MLLHHAFAAAYSQFKLTFYNFDDEIKNILNIKDMAIKKKPNVLQNMPYYYSNYSQPTTIRGFDMVNKNLYLVVNKPCDWLKQIT